MFDFAFKPNSNSHHKVCYDAMEISSSFPTSGAGLISFSATLKNNLILSAEQKSAFECV